MHLLLKLLYLLLVILFITDVVLKYLFITAPRMRNTVIIQLMEIQYYILKKCMVYPICDFFFFPKEWNKKRRNHKIMRYSLFSRIKSTFLCKQSSHTAMCSFGQLMVDSKVWMWCCLPICIVQSSLLDCSIQEPTEAYYISFLVCTSFLPEEA